MDAPAVLDPAHCAVAIIDMQQGVASRGIWDADRRKRVVANCIDLVAGARKAGVHVVFVKVERRADVTDAPKTPFQRDGPPPKDRRLAFNDPSARLVDGLEATEADDVVIKRRIDVFHGTAIEQLLRTKGITTVVFGGIATNWGVEASARSARDRDFDVIIAEDCCDAFDEASHTFPITKTFPVFGAVMSGADFLAHLAPGASER
jgi:nicotinamidase-related amidase